MPRRLLPGTPIAVDYWTKRDVHGRICFLTHMHSDHTQGLSSSWSDQLIYCSDITRSLAIAHLGIDPLLLVALPIGESTIIPLDDVGLHSMTVTLIDANHCAGAVMFLFQGYFGNILHTGDFRYHDKILDIPPFSNGIDINTLYLDNTYCDPVCEFPTRDKAKKMILDIIHKHPEKEILLGMDTLGKEQLLCEIADELQVPIFVDKFRYKTAEVLGCKEYFTLEYNETYIKVEGKRKVNASTITYRNKWFTPVVGIVVSAFYERQNQASHIDNQSFYIVPFSDHSSFSELKEFVSKVRPQRIIPVVDIKARIEGSHDRADMSIFEPYINADECQHVIDIPLTVQQFMTRGFDGLHKVDRLRKRKSTKSFFNKKNKRPCGIIFSPSKNEADRSNISGRRTELYRMSNGSPVNVNCVQNVKEEVNVFECGKISSHIEEGIAVEHSANLLLDVKKEIKEDEEKNIWDISNDILPTFLNTGNTLPGMVSVHYFEPSVIMKQERDEDNSSTNGKKQRLPECKPNMDTGKSVSRNEIEVCFSNFVVDITKSSDTSFIEEAQIFLPDAKFCSSVENIQTTWQKRLQNITENEKDFNGKPRFYLVPIKRNFESGMKINQDRDERIFIKHLCVKKKTSNAITQADFQSACRDKVLKASLSSRSIETQTDFTSSHVDSGDCSNHVDSVVEEKVSPTEIELCENIETSEEYCTCQSSNCDDSETESGMDRSQSILPSLSQIELRARPIVKSWKSSNIRSSPPRNRNASTLNDSIPFEDDKLQGLIDRFRSSRSRAVTKRSSTENISGRVSSYFSKVRVPIKKLRETRANTRAKLATTPTSLKEISRCKELKKKNLRSLTVEEIFVLEKNGELRHTNHGDVSQAELVLAKWSSKK